MYVIAASSWAWQLPSEMILLILDIGFLFSTMSYSGFELYLITAHESCSPAILERAATVKAQTSCVVKHFTDLLNAG